MYTFVSILRKVDSQAKAAEKLVLTLVIRGEIQNMVVGFNKERPHTICQKRYYCVEIEFAGNISHTV